MWYAKQPRELPGIRASVQTRSRVLPVLRWMGRALLPVLFAMLAPLAEAEAPGTQPQTQSAAQSQPNDRTLVPLKVDLPEPPFDSTPRNLPTTENLAPNYGQMRIHQDEPMMVPRSANQNVALDKPVTASEDFPIIGSADLVTDGDASHTVGTYLELGPGKQWVQIDLGQPHRIYAICIWHYWNIPRVYHDVVIRLSIDDNFNKGYKTVFNNDHDNSSDLGKGMILTISKVVKVD
jgi:hypothetical protein